MARLAPNVVVCCVLSLALAVVATAGIRAEPRLTLERRSPLVVRGVGFVPGERVVVTALTLTGPRRTGTRASSIGRFRIVLRTTAQPCGKPLAVRARGGRGSIATLVLDAAPCVPPPVD